ncbi:IS3 family transposase [Tenacibaculum maritimum]|nr:IS3 family transposase [Tenacibaculum maritimum]MDB0601123.1 IS3 family transposase [Tenacibaculum maritimum]
MYRNDKVIRRYSEPFKLKILAELTIGKHTKSELCKLYSIAPTTVNEWIKKYNRKDLMNTRVKVETKDEISRIKALQKEIEQLKKLLLKKDLDAMVMDSYLEVAAEDLGYKSVNELKKAKYKGLIKAKEKSKRFASLTTITHCFGLKRDAYYKYKSRADKRLELEKQIIKIVRKRRKSLPREGVRKLVKSLDVDFNKGNIKIGRDTLFNVLRKNQMLTLRKKTSARTTNSYHRFYKYNNIIKDLEVTRANQVWASDITYIRTVKGFCYLALITDMYSRKIVGYDLSDSLELKGCVRALNKAIYQAKNIKQLIHHSDRGIQYCSNVYTQILKRKKIDISMTQENHCYENAMAERVNGILKDEFYLDQTFDNVAHAKRAAKNAINLYNEVRLHLSLDFKTPNMVYKLSA